MDRQLELDIQKGKSDAFERLFDLYAERLIHLSYAILANSADVEDVVQDALIGFVEALQSGRFRGGNGTVEAYLRRSVRNRCIDRLRRAGRFHLSLDEYDPIAHEFHDPSLWPSQVLEEKQLRERFEQEILHLPDSQRTVVILRFLEQYSYREISEELHISIDHVKNLLGRARKRLRQELEPLFHSER